MRVHEIIFGIPEDGTSLTTVRICFRITLGGALSRGGAGPRGGAWSQGECLVWEGVETPPVMATAAGGTHPTGMHSCLHFSFENRNFLFPRMSQV